MQALYEAAGSGQDLANAVHVSFFDFSHLQPSLQARSAAHPLLKLGTEVIEDDVTHLQYSFQPEKLLLR
jgi:hypothetical protein